MGNGTRASGREIYEDTRRKRGAGEKWVSARAA